MAVATGVLIGSFIFLGALVAIPTFLIFGLALPIYLGWKIPRQLAVAGLVAILVAVPLAGLAETDILRTPSPPAASDTTSPNGNGGSVLSNAVATPYAGAEGALYTFTVDVNASYLVPGVVLSGHIVLDVSTCAGATGNNSPSCSTPYPFYTQNETLPANLTTATVTFTQALPGPNIWWWTIGAEAENSTNHTLLWIFLDPANGYGTIQGPVTGNFASTFILILPAILVDLLFYPALVFYFALLIYMLFKNRERRRKQAQEAAKAADMPPDTAAAATPSTSPGTPSLSSGSSAAKPVENACPNCGAVVYPGEKTCWKCGVALGPTASSDAPLPSTSK
ncbi:MAG: zinc ribbon domain-containing protein [Thermoplasmata archaeon]